MVREVDLFRMISGEETPDTGTVDVGETVHLGYVDQSRDSLSDEKTVWRRSRKATRSFKSANTRLLSRLRRPI